MESHHDKNHPTQNGTSQSNHGFNFSDHNRELRDTLDPDTQERVLLLTKKQLLKKLLEDLKSF